jgi:hypothetical protein
LSSAGSKQRQAPSAEQDGRYERHTTSKAPPHLKEPYVRLGPLYPLTVTLPSMKGCGTQKYAYFLPAFLKVCEYLCPLRKSPESNAPLSAVAVC